RIHKDLPNRKGSEANRGGKGTGLGCRKEGGTARGVPPLASGKFAGHEEQRLYFETLEDGAKSLGAVVLLDVDDFFSGGDGFDGHIIVAAVFQNHQAPVNAVEDQVESQVAIGHGNDGVDSIGITAADQVAE